MTLIVWIFLWIAVFLAIQIWAQFSYPERYRRGYIWRALDKIFRVHRPKPSGGSAVLHVYFRSPTDILREIAADICFLVVVGLAINFGLLALGIDLRAIGTPLAGIVRAFDDVVNGDQDRWKRYWRTVKNRVKWRWTPAPTPVPIPVRDP